MIFKKLSLGLIITLVTIISLTFTNPVLSETAAEIDQEVDIALEKLFKQIPVSNELAKVAKGILVFPDVLKAGLVVGLQRGVGALRQGHMTNGYYKTVAASYGMQAGAQSFGYALFFLSDSAFEYMNKTNGWEIGVGPSIVVVDQGLAKSLTTTTANDDIYAFFFDQKGLMAGMGLQGSKISRYNPK